MSKILTFVITNRSDKEFITDFYEMENFISSTNAILLLRAKNFVEIFQVAPDNYKFRLVIHEGLKNRGGYSRSDAIITELESSFPHLRNKKIVFITRHQDLFPNLERVITDSNGVHLNFNKCNVDSIVESLPVYTKSDFLLPGNTDAAGLENSDIANEKLDFALITALFDKEFEVFKANCTDFGLAAPYNSYNYAFKELDQAVKNEYGKKFMILHQEKMGLVDAAIHSTQAITLADPSFLIMPGVCGGRKGEVELYDIIIPTIVHDYATGKFHAGKLYSKDYKSYSNQKLINYLNNKKDDIVHRMRGLISGDRKSLMGPNFKIAIGEMACGPWVVKTDGLLDKMASISDQDSIDDKQFVENLPVDNISKHIVGLEMESYSILRAAEVLQKEGRYALIIKSVMDFTNELKNDGPNGEIKSSAAYLSYLCVRAIMPLLIEFKETQQAWK